MDAYKGIANPKHHSALPVVPNPKGKPSPKGKADPKRQPSPRRDSSPSRVPKSELPCFTLSRTGTRSKGDKCEYSHDPGKIAEQQAKDAKKPPPVPKGAAAGKAQPRPKRPMSPPKGPPGHKPQMCKYFQAGNCAHGDQCDFQHTQSGHLGIAFPVDLGLLNLAGPLPAKGCLRTKPYSGQGKLPNGEGRQKLLRYTNPEREIRFFVTNGEDWDGIGYGGEP